MKTTLRLFIVALIVILAGKAIGQGSSFAAYTEKGELFTLYVNGDQKNSKPSDHVRYDDIVGPTFKIKIVFQDPSIKEITKSIFNKIDGEFFYVLRPGKKGEYTMEHSSVDYVSSAKTEETPPPPPPPAEKKQEQAATSGEKKSTGGCTNPMAEGDFQSSIAVIYNAPFEGPKTSNLKKLVETHCLYARQIIEAMHVVSYESSHLTIAKAAYLHCYDPENYGMVKDELNDRSRAELENYMKSVAK